MPDEPVTLFGRLRLTARATVFHPPQVFGRLRPGMPKPLGSRTAVHAYMAARNADAKARKVRLDHEQTVAECISYFAPGSCPEYRAAEAFTKRVTQKHMWRPTKRPPRAKNASRHIGI